MPSLVASAASRCFIDSRSGRSSARIHVSFSNMSSTLPSPFFRHARGTREVGNGPYVLLLFVGLGLSRSMVIESSGLLPPEKLKLKSKSSIVMGLLVARVPGNSLRFPPLTRTFGEGWWLGFFGVLVFDGGTRSCVVTTEEEGTDSPFSGMLVFDGGTRSCMVTIDEEGTDSPSTPPGCNSPSLFSSCRDVILTVETVPATEELSRLTRSRCEFANVSQ